MTEDTLINNSEMAEQSLLSATLQLVDLLLVPGSQDAPDMRDRSRQVIKLAREVKTGLSAWQIVEISEEVVVTKEQYENAMAVIKAYKRQRWQSEFPKEINRDTIDFEDFYVTRSLLRVSPRKEVRRAYIVFKKSQYMFSDNATMINAGFNRGGNFRIPAVWHNDPFKALFYYLLLHIAPLENITADVLKLAFEHFNKNYFKTGPYTVTPMENEFRIFVDNPAYMAMNFSMKKIKNSNYEFPDTQMD